MALKKGDKLEVALRVGKFFACSFASDEECAEAAKRIKELEEGKREDDAAFARCMKRNKELEATLNLRDKGNAGLQARITAVEAIVFGSCRLNCKVKAALEKALKGD